MVEMVQGRPARTLAAAAVALLAAAAPAAAGERADLTLAYGTQRPATPTALELAVRYYDPADREGKPPALDAAAFELPAGTRIDQGAAPQCTASDAELHLLGARACPEGSRIGTGTLEAMTGLPGDPVRGDVTVFNGRGELVEIVTVPGTGAVAGMDRLTVEGTTLRAHPPSIPGGPPDGRTAIREIRVTLPVRVGPGGRALLTTPGTCPADRVWRGAGVFAFGDGGTATEPAGTPCRDRADRRPRHTSRRGTHRVREHRAVRS